MQIQDLYLAFIAGRQLPNLGTRTARALLDMARSALLSRGKRLKPSTASDPASIKTELLQAHRALVGGEPVYNSAAPQETCSIQEAEQCLAMLRANNATKKPSNKITAASTRPSVRPATTATTRPTPARVQAPAPARPTPPAKAAVRPPAPTVNPLSDYSLSKLGWLATHQSATASDRVAAKAELRRRGATITASGIVSQSTRRQPK
jgi:hypothetical protein